MRGLLGFIAFLVVAESLFRALPVSTSTETGYYLDPLIVTYPPHHVWTSATGWDLRNAQHHQSNNAGFLAHRDFRQESRAVALIGDSFVEASMLDAEERPGAQLERNLAGRPVFSMGGPGSALLDYAERIRLAHSLYGVKDFVVVMERADIRQSLCGSRNIHGPCLSPTTLEARVETMPTAGLVKRIFRHSAFLQYSLSQLKVSVDQFWPPAFLSMNLAAAVAAVVPPTTFTGRQVNLPTSLTQEEMQSIDAVSAKFFDTVKPLIEGNLVIVIDSDRRALYLGRPMADPARDRFMTIARAAGAQVIDTASIFETSFGANGLKFDVGPYDTHFNALGIRLISEAAALALEPRHGSRP